jgi:hypothetical protein
MVEMSIPAKIAINSIYVTVTAPKPSLKIYAKRKKTPLVVVVVVEVDLVVVVVVVVGGTRGNSSSNEII